MENKTQLTVELSPGTLRKVEEDVDYRLRLLQQVAGNTYYNQVTFQLGTESTGPPQSEDFVPIGTADGMRGLEGGAVAGSESNEFSEVLSGEANAEGISDLPSCSSQAEKKLVWLEAPTKLLIAKVKELRPKIGKSAKLKNKKMMWRVISEELCAKGHFFNDGQVEAKFFSLERQYKRVVLNNKKTGRGRQICPFQSELDDLLQERVSINPEYSLGSEQSVEPNATRDTEESCDSAPATPENVEPTPSSSRRRGKSNLNLFIEKFDKESERQEQGHRDFMKISEESLKQKKDNAEKKQQIQTRQLDILESLVNILKK